MQTCDAVIVGGGLIGGSIAFELARLNVDFLVLDRQQPGREASWAAAGMLSPAPDTPQDIPLVPLAKQSLRLYPEFIAAVEETSGLSTAYRLEGSLQIFSTPHAEADRDKMVEDYRQLGLAAEPISLDTMRRLAGAFCPTAGAAGCV